jgi:ketosteroid isomerase-like protein
MNETISRLRDAMNRHDAEAMAALFAANYRSEQPLHPQRGFGGKQELAADWSRRFDEVPDLEGGVVKESTDGSTSWSEWVWHGSRVDGTPFLMKGVMVMGLADDGLITWARLYTDSVEQTETAIDEAVRPLSGSTG